MGVQRAAQRPQFRTWRCIKFGTFWGAAFTFIDQNIFFGKLPFTWRNPQTDHELAEQGVRAPPIDYPKPDGVITFDRLSSVFLVEHESRRRPAVAPEVEG